MGLPRARGDGPLRHAHWLLTGRASPRSRGWTLKTGAWMPHGAGFPALAGMDPSVPPPRLATSRASPRSRGWTHHPVAVDQAVVGFPALAGMDPAGARSSPRSPRLPRARGDGPWRDPDSGRRIVASPRSRGWTPCMRRLTRSPLGFPALAGWTRPVNHRRKLGCGFPALAGMDPALYI